MKPFEVTLNGAKQCVAGVEDGVLTAILTFVRRTGETDESLQTDASESLEIRVGGLANIGPGISEHVEWLYHTLSVGDEVTIKIQELQECDTPKTRETVYVQCSFCGKKQAEVRKLIAGPHVFICDECVGDASPKDVASIVGVPTAHICNQCLKTCEEILLKDIDFQDEPPE